MTELIKSLEEVHPSTYYWIIVLSIWIKCAFELYLCFRQRLVLKSTSNDDRIPAPLTIQTLDIFVSERGIGVAKLNQEIFTVISTAVFWTIFLQNGDFYGMWVDTKRMSSSFSERNFCFIFAYIYLQYLILVLPGLVYECFSNFETREYLKKANLPLLLRVPFTALLVFIPFYLLFRTLGTAIWSKILLDNLNVIYWKTDRYDLSFFFNLWFRVWIIFSILYYLWRKLIRPCFKYLVMVGTCMPLQMGPLRRRIEGLTNDIFFPLRSIQVLTFVDDVRKPSNSLCSLYGPRWWSIGINLIDVSFQGDGSNLRVVLKRKNKNNRRSSLKTYTVDEIEAMLAQELGHWYFYNSAKNDFFFLLCVFFGVFFIRWFVENPAVFKAVGFPSDFGEVAVGTFDRLKTAFFTIEVKPDLNGHHDTPLVVGIVVVYHFLFRLPIAILNWMRTSYSRYQVFQKDAFAGKLGYKDRLKSALVKIEFGEEGNGRGIDDLEYPMADPLYSSYYCPRPNLFQRLEQLNNLR